MTGFEIGAEFGAPMADEEANAQGLLSIKQMAVLTGVAEEELRLEFHRQRGSVPQGQLFSFQLPKEWVRRGKERAALARVDDMGHAMQVLRVVDGLDARWVDPTGAVWIVTGSGVPGAPLMSTRGSATCPPAPRRGTSGRATSRCARSSPEG